MDLAAALSVRIPQTRRISTQADLEEWSAQGGFPAVLKTDRSWGGLGVTVVDNLEQAGKAFRTATHPSMTAALKQLTLRRDPTHVLGLFSHAVPSITIQGFIEGRPANRAVVCWQGEVLAGISVSALQTQGPTGPATVVQIIENEEMAGAARKLVRALGLSGFCGLDFVIEVSSGDAYLVELNPRATPTSHLALGPGRDLPVSLHAQLTGRSADDANQHATNTAIRNDVIAMFPGEWRRDPQSPYFRSAFHDVPWAEVELVRECSGPIWEERGLAARIRMLLKPGCARDRVLFPLPGGRIDPDSVSP